MTKKRKASVSFGRGKARKGERKGKGRRTDSTTPVTVGRLVLVGVVGLDGRDELGELGLVLFADLTEGEARRGLAADDGAEAGLRLDDDVCAERTRGVA